MLIPAYNCHDDLECTLASLAETAPVHVLVVDDGSTPLIVPTPRAGLIVEVVRMPRNGGIESALATGIEALAARGFRYAARFDAGDLAVPGRLAKQRAFLATHPRVACVGTWTQVVSREGRPLFMLTPPTDPVRLRRTRFLRSPLVHPSVMLDIQRVLEVGNYRIKYPAAEDLDIFLRLMEHYDCANLPERGLYYELNERGISVTRRFRQIGSTLALVLCYFDVRNPYDWGGLVKSLLHFVTPCSLLHKLKRHMFA
ncbi:MAG: hypothetical protein E5299_01169 [Burkholderia gladioli]|nr:MAG: hypothetical protein E5299_01169 [Burkholderia gladioli]